MTQKKIVTLTEGSALSETNAGIDATKWPSPNAQATLIIFMAIDIVKLAIAGFSQALTVSAIAVICNFDGIEHEPDSMRLWLRWGHRNL